MNDNDNPNVISFQKRLDRRRRQIRAEEELLAMIEEQCEDDGDFRMQPVEDGSTRITMVVPPDMDPLDFLAAHLALFDMDR